MLSKLEVESLMGINVEDEDVASLAILYFLSSEDMPKDVSNELSTVLNSDSSTISAATVEYFLSHQDIAKECMEKAKRTSQAYMDLAFKINAGVETPMKLIFFLILLMEEIGMEDEIKEKITSFIEDPLEHPLDEDILEFIYQHQDELDKCKNFMRMLGQGSSPEEERKSEA